MASATGTIGPKDYAVAVVAGQHSLTADEPPDRGGQDAGPAPHELLCAALAACTAITLRMYAQRNEWPLAEVRVEVALEIQGAARSIHRRLRLGGDLDTEQRARLADVAERTPVTLTLKQGATITTVLA
jgi:putative redox protein